MTWISIQVHRGIFHFHGVTIAVTTTTISITAANKSSIDLKVSGLVSTDYNNEAPYIGWL
jgi:hypothetical protein